MNASQNNVAMQNLRDVVITLATSDGKWSQDYKLNLGDGEVNGIEGGIQNISYVSSLLKMLREKSFENVKRTVGLTKALDYHGAMSSKLPEGIANNYETLEVRIQ